MFLFDELHAVLLFEKQAMEMVVQVWASARTEEEIAKGAATGRLAMVVWRRRRRSGKQRSLHQECSLCRDRKSKNNKSFSVPMFSPFPRPLPPSVIARPASKKNRANWNLNFTVS